MKRIQILLLASVLLLLSACFDLTGDKATRNTLNIVNMKVGAATTMRVFFEEPYNSNYYNDYYYNNLFFDDWSNTFVYDPYPNMLFPYSDVFNYKPYGFYYAKSYDGNGTAVKRFYNDLQTLYTSIDYTYDYSESKQYYLNITNRSFLMFETYGSDAIKVSASHLRYREQSLIIFGSSSSDASLRIPLDVRVLTNVKASRADRVSINLVNALPTEEGSNLLPALQYESTLHVEVNGVRVSTSLDYRENDRFEIAGVSDAQESIALTLVLSNGTAPTWSKKLQNGHTYNVIVGHSHNRLSAEPTLFVYDVTPAKDNT